MLIAQITDPHVAETGSEPDRIYRTGWHLTRALAHLDKLARRPDAIVITGDLVYHGSVGDYARLREVVATTATPVYLLAGNHDDRANLRGAFADHAYLPRRGFLHYTIEHLSVRGIALDTQVAGEVGGAMCAERLAWLADRLAEQPNRPTIVFMHHPPFATGVARMDEWSFGNAEAFGELVARHRQIERIVCGHLHRPVVVRWNGTVVSTCPGTAYQIGLNLGNGNAPLEMVGEPPCCLLHLWTGAGRLVTHTSYIGEYEKLPRLD